MHPLLNDDDTVLIENKRKYDSFDDSSFNRRGRSEWICGRGKYRIMTHIYQLFSAVYHINCLFVSRQLI